MSPFFFVWRLVPLSMGGLSSWVSRTVCLSTRPSACRCRTIRDTRVRELCLAARLSLPLVPPNLLVFLSGAFRAIPPCDILNVRGSPMAMFLPLPLSSTSNRTQTFLHVHLHLLKNQSALIYGWLYLSTKNVITIGGMGKRIMPLAVSTSL
jgi:hypothetical protein